MKILHVVPSLDRAGAEKQMSLLVRGLPRAEFDVHVCASTAADRWRPNCAARAFP